MAKRIVLGISGGIAAVKAPELVRSLVEARFDVRCVLTPEASKFVAPMPLAVFSGHPVYHDMFGADVHEMPHLKLAAEADLFLVAPATASLLAKFAAGLSDDFVTLTYIATVAPVLVAPAMHPTMWNHPSTRANVATLKQRSVGFVGPHIGQLADNTSGDGRMAEPADIVAAAIALLNG
jgi:phosphopantothenoylcysteine decarboxylase/phosphopantothenate--cysteine ligase